jgi:4-hydroxybenzoate polyprenyltransferase
VAASLRIAAGLHAATVLLLLLLPAIEPLGVFYIAGVVATAGLLVYEHRIVRPDDLSRVNEAFFTVNGAVSFLLLLATAADVATGR